MLNSPIRLLLADDHDLILEGIAKMVSQQGFEVVARARNGREAWELYPQVQPDVCLLDLRMPEMDGLECSRRILKHDSRARIIVLTTFDSEDEISRCLEVGVRGYLLKDVRREELLHCIREVHLGHNYLAPTVASRVVDHFTKTPLTRRENQVLQHLSAGLSNKEIAVQLSITEGTVKLHVNNLFQKLGARSRTEAMAMALKRGLIQLS